MHAAIFFGRLYAMKLDAVQVFAYTLPLRRPLPLPSGTLTERKGYLLKLTGDNGVVGWGEAAPLPGFSEESLDEAESVLTQVPARLAGYRLPVHYADLEGASLIHIRASMAVSFAIESAYFNLMARTQGVPLHRYLRSDAPNTITKNALLAGDADAIVRRAGGLLEDGYSTAKLKVGGRPVEDDIALVRAVRAAMGPGLTLRLDANRQWDLATAVHFGQSVRDCGIEYLEEPVREPYDMPIFLEQAKVPYALDETMHTCFRDVREKLGPMRKDTPELRSLVHQLSIIFRMAGACLWKPSLLHDANLGETLANNGFGFPINRLILTGAFEAGVGTAAIAAYAAAYGTAGLPSGLDPYNWLAEDVLVNRLPMDDPAVDVTALHHAAGEVDESRLTLLAEA
jgi:O-succinylbenzoate synthase